MTFFKESLLKTLGIALLPLVTAPDAAANKRVFRSFQKEIEPMLSEYCYECHGFGSSKGGIAFDELSEESIADHELWMRVLKNTRAHVMPPIEEDQPSDQERDKILAWVKSGPFQIKSKNPDPGQLTVQRLNRVEYQNTIRDLVGIEFDAADAFPADDSGEGFDNLGEILSLSPMMLEKYLDAANRIISEAVPTQPRVLPQTIFEEEKLVQLFSATTNEEDISKDALQLSFYTPSIRTAQYNITKTGRYQIAINIKPVSFSSFNGFDYNRCRFIFRIDDEAVFEKEFEFVSGKTFEHTFDYDWEPSQHSFSFEVIPLTQDQELEKIKKLKMRVEQLVISGPHAPEEWVKPANYDRFFPGGVPSDITDKSEYTREILSSFASRAFRRPIDQETTDRLVLLAQTIADQDGYTYEMGVAQAMVATLASPRFLFREEDSLAAKSKKQHPLIDEYSLASRLSYFLWSTMPDEELFALADAGELRKNLDTQIQRMIADERSSQFIKNFAGQWLHARDIGSVNISRIDVWLRENPNPEFEEAKKEYSHVREIAATQRTPEEEATYQRTRKIMRALYDKKIPNLQVRELRAMREETEYYFDYIIRNDRSLKELLDSDYTFLNETLAEHYGIDGVTGNHMRKVTLSPESPRGGVLTQGTLLAFTSNPTRTSPVKRGVFILENILGTPPAAPPPNIASLEDISSESELEALSLRETLALHREKKLCASCHNRMDPLGLAFENFNAMGIWRDSELNQPIDPGGMLITGEHFTTIQEMKQILATDRIKDFYYCVSEKMLTYALGRGIEYYDTNTIDQLVDKLIETDGKPSTLIEGIINSVPFQKRRHPNFATH